MKRHDLDSSALVAGMLLALESLVVIAQQAGAIHLSVATVVAGAVLAAGFAVIVGLLITLRRNTGPKPGDDEPSVAS